MGEEELRNIANAIVDEIDADWTWDVGHDPDVGKEAARLVIIDALKAAYSAGVRDGIQDS